MKVSNMTRKQFDQLPQAEYGKEMDFAALVIMPTRRMHDSGYRCMDFAAVDIYDEAICRISGCSDVLHLDGIGGYGHRWTRIPTSVPVSGWTFDCLPKSGLLRLFVMKPGGIHWDGLSLSSLEIFAKHGG